LQGRPRKGAGARDDDAAEEAQRGALKNQVALFKTDFPALGNLCFAWVWVALQRGSKEKSMCDSMSYLRSWRVFAHAAGRESVLHRKQRARETLSSTQQKLRKKSPKPVLRIQFSLVFSGLFLWGHDGWSHVNTFNFTGFF